MTRKEKILEAMEVIRQAMEEEVLRDDNNIVVSNILINRGGIYKLYMFEDDRHEIIYESFTKTLKVAPDWVPLEGRLLEVQKRLEDINKQVTISNNEAFKLKKEIDYLQSTIAELKGG